jgi:hypothetical protein
MGYHIRMRLQETGWKRHGLDLYGSKYGQVADYCEYGNEPSGSIKYGEFLD